MMFLACNQVIATSHPQTIVMGRQFFDPSVVKHPPHRVPASFIYAEQDGHKIKFQQNLFGEMIKVIGNHSIMKPAASISDNELKRNENSEVFTQKALAIKEQKGNFYELEITANPIARLNPSATSDKYICVDLKYMDEKNMAVYTNSRTGMQYIYDRQNRIAFSHYIDELDGDWILDEYGIRTWVESLPAKNISMASLASSYHIIGL